MSTPRLDKSDRPLHRAEILMWVLGIIFITIGSVVLTIGVIPGLGTQGRQFGSLGAFFGTPGVANILAAIFLKQRRFWAVLFGLLAAMLELAIALGLTIDWISFFLERGKPLYAMLIAPFSVAIITMIVFLIINLAYSMSLIQRPPSTRRGFEPVRVEPIDQATIPAETISDDGGSNVASSKG